MMVKKILKKVWPSLYGRLSNKKKEMIINKFQMTYPQTKIFDKTEMMFYSQENQDYIVYNNFFLNKKDGIFCDIGGNDPLKFNNTRYFEELGWNGFAFEPLPNMQKLWKDSRKATFFPFAVSDIEGKVTFSIVADNEQHGDMNSFITKTKSDTYNYSASDITVKTRPLKNVFAEEKITKIDYMSLDVEGHEINVLKGIDFSKVTINVLTIENNPSCCHLYGDDRIRDIMFKHNYVLWGRIIGLDDIYVHKKFLEENQNA